MADRYLRATGDWDGPVWAATSGGAAGSAATPTAGDDVYIAANFTVTLTADASCHNLSHTNGKLDLKSYKLAVTGYQFNSTGSTTRTIDMGSGTLELTNQYDWANLNFNLSGTNLSFWAGTSLLILNVDGYDYSNFNTLSKTFNDVQINIGQQNFGGGKTLNITGSMPSFRSLIIQSKNSAAHTVNFDDGTSIPVDKFIAIGSSTANKLTIKSETGETPAVIGEKIYGTGSSYGQSVAMQDVLPNFSKPYIGSNSTQTLSGWLLQDPPKISTLVDPLTTAPGSNSNWSASGTVTQVTTGESNGGYKFSYGSIVSTDTYDFVDDEIVFEFDDSLNIDYGYRWYFLVGGSKATWMGVEMIAGAYVARSFDSYIEAYAKGRGVSGSNMLITDSLPAHKFVKLSYSKSSNNLDVYYSDTGASWTLAGTRAIPPDQEPLLRSVRVSMSDIDGSEVTIGSINILPPPVAGMKVWTGADWAEKPVKVWTGADWEEKPVKYWDGNDWV